MNKPKLLVAVIGGGPAGLMAAGTAATCGAQVILMEKNEQCGRKLLITGSGRCNITNSAPFDQFLSCFPENRKFLMPAFRQFFVPELIEFFNRYQLSFVLEENGKYFPETQKAASVLAVLIAFCRDQQVEFHLNEPVSVIDESDQKWLIQTNRGVITADALILATGGLSYPKTGSVGDGHRLATSLAHTIIPTRPVLVPLAISNPDCAPLSGVSLKDVVVSLWDTRLPAAPKKIADQRGSLLFTHFGVSGPPVLFISRWLPPNYDQPENVNSYELTVDLCPDQDLPNLEKCLIDAFASTPKRLLRTVLNHNLDIPQAASSLIIKHCHFNEDICCQHITKENRRVLLKVLKSFSMSIARTRGYKEAMVTAGGVSTREIDPRTMESKLHRGLYFAGELIDVDGYTGGFNLQAAFSTGYLAGKAAAQR